MRDAHTLGRQRATTRVLPPGRADGDAVKLARSLGMNLDPWQAEILTESARTQGDRWSAFESCAIVPRQNGKSFLIVARALAGALLYDEKLILYSAHEYRTAREVWRTMRDVCESDVLAPFVEKIAVWGGETIIFRNGARFKLIARTRTAGRGMSPDCLLFDEAFALTEDVLSATLPSMSARPNPQVLYFSSAATWEALALLKLRQRGHAPDPKGYAYWEWHATPDVDVRDPEVWRATNPGFGYRLTEAAIRRELEAMSHKTFLRERLGVWSESAVDSVLQDDDIEGLVIPVPKPPRDGRTIGWGIDVASPDRSGAAIAAAFFDDDDIPVVTLVETRGGAGWVPERLGELIGSYGSEGVAYDNRGGIVDLMERAERDYDVGLKPLHQNSYPSACAAFVQRVTEKRIRIAQAPALVSDCTSAIARQFIGGWVWERRTATPPTALIAATCALHALEHSNDGVAMAF